MHARGKRKTGNGWTRLFAHKWWIITIFFIAIQVLLCVFNAPSAYTTMIETSRLDNPWVIVVTPTYTNPSQRLDLTRLAATLQPISKLHWIIVENRDDITEAVSGVIAGHPGIAKVSHFAHPTPPDMDKRGHHQRNAAIEFILSMYSEFDRAVVSFSDDDNAYDARLFEDFRLTKRVRVCPVAFSGNKAVESFTVVEGKIVSWDAWWRRVFEIDMAGFAVNLDLIRSRQPRFGDFMEGRNEDHFLRQVLGDTNELVEPGCGDGTNVWAWHVKTDIRIKRENVNLNETY